MKFKILIAIFTIVIATLAISNTSKNKKYSLLELSNIEALSDGTGDPNLNSWIPEYALLWHLEETAQLTANANGDLTIYKFNIGNYQANFVYNVYFAGFICKPVSNACCDSSQQRMSQFKINSKEPV